MSNKSTKYLDLTTDRKFIEYLRRVLPIRFGTGSTLPDPTGHAGEFLSTDGATFFWDAPDFAYSTVANYAALPAPATVPNEIYVVLNSQGTKWLPGWLGGTFYSKGFYYSNGSTWSFLGEVPYEATQSDVNAEVVTDQFVSPATLGGWITQKEIDCGGV